MKLLVTGAHGLLGRTLLCTDWGVPLEWSACGRGDEPVGGIPCHAVDLTDRAAVGSLLDRVRPDAVIHTAAVTNVDRCETEPELARRVNRDAVGHVVEAADAVGARVAHLSTDYVFDGRNGPYGEQDEPHPLSTYGRLKLESEALVTEAPRPGLVLRTLWLYGHVAGVRPNLVTWPLGALLRREPMRIVDDQWGNPTWVEDLARALVELMRQQVAGCFHLGGGTFLNRYELVQRIAAHFHLDAGAVQPTTTAEAGQAAPRPLRSGLRTDAVRAALGWDPADIDDGLRRLAAQADFQSDFGGLLQAATRTTDEPS